MDGRPEPPAPGEPAELPADAVVVGRVAGAFGVRGALKVQPYSADPKALFSSKRWYLQRAAAPGRPAEVRLLRVRQAHEHKEAVVATIDELDDRDAALRCTGALIAVARSSFPTPAADEFYWVDLIGLAVVNRDGVALGVVAGLVETGPHCVLRIAAADGRETLVPFVDAYVDWVDRAAGCIVVDWQPGD